MKGVVDFAIVGAGCGGLYTAWRLANTPGHRNIVLFEARDLVGGRLATAFMPAMPFLSELGGMRYTTGQLIFRSLVKALGLTPICFKFDLQLMYLGGYHLRSNDAPPYRVALRERQKKPAELLKHAIRCALAEIKLEDADGNRRTSALAKKLRAIAECEKEIKLTPNEWRLLKRTAELHGSRLYEIGFWNLLQYYLSSEAFLFVHDGLGYESVLTNWNAAEAIPWFLRDFDVRTEYKTVEEGMQAVPRALEVELIEECPDCIRFEHTLTSIIKEPGSKGLLKLVFNEGAESMLAKHVILAIPKAALQKLVHGGLEGFDAELVTGLEDILDSVTAQPLFKLFLGYNRAWWSDPQGLGSASGRATTDLPIRQVYYFGPDTARIRVREDRRHSPGAMIMASYSDAHYVDFWKHMFPVEGADPFYDLAVEELNPAEIVALERYGVTKNMALKAHRQIMQMHPSLASRDNVSPPYVALAMDWMKEPYCGGWHSWNVKYRPWEVIRKLKNPLDGNVHICGEAYSCEQGWAEGAFVSAELALKQIGVAPPDWIKEKEYKELGFRGYEHYIEWDG